MSRPLSGWFSESERVTFQHRMNDLATFAKAHLASGDIDPVYPVLRGIIRERRLTYEEAFWQVSLYLAFYNLPSALAAFREHPLPSVPYKYVLKYPTGVERRGLRDRRCMEEHFRSYLDVVGEDGPDWLSAQTSMEHGVQSFSAFWEAAQTVKYNG